MASWAAAPAAATGNYVQPDDHEVVNDYAGETVDPTRYANGWQAFHECDTLVPECWAVRTRVGLAVLCGLRVGMVL